MEEREKREVHLVDGRTQVLCSVDVVSEGTLKKLAAPPHTVRHLTSASRTHPPSSFWKDRKLSLDHVGRVSNMALLMTYFLGPREQPKKRGLSCKTMWQEGCFAALRHDPLFGVASQGP